MTSLNGFLLPHSLPQVAIGKPRDPKAASTSGYLGSLPASATFFLRVKFFRPVAAFVPGLRKSFSKTTPLDLSWRCHPDVSVAC